MTAFSSILLASALSFDAGGDLRIRQELMENIPGLPGGGVTMPSARDGFTDHMRFRVRAWGEAAWKDEDVGAFRLYLRLADEMRWTIEPYKSQFRFPDEAIIDNLYLEGKGLFGGRLDFTAGRQDIYQLYGLDHIFVDGTPGDGSRTVYADMVRATLHFDEESTLDVFAIYNEDDNLLRWGTDACRHRSLTGFGGGAEAEMDDWGWGAIWGSKASVWLPYQVFAMQKNTASFRRGDVKHPRQQRELAGFKLLPQLNEEWSLQLEAMGQVGADSRGDMLSGWSTYAGINWKSATASTVKPYVKLGYHFMSGDDDAASEDGGHGAWDPMWSRGVNDSELMVYGTLYGFSWWSNMHFVKLTAGAGLGRGHSLSLSTGPMFASAQDGLGGGDGMFKGLLSQARYDFPIWLADPAKGERLYIFGHILAELFNPGDYFITDKPAWFIRWQLDFKF